MPKVPPGLSHTHRSDVLANHQHTISAVGFDPVARNPLLSYVVQADDGLHYVGVNPQLTTITSTSTKEIRHMQSKLRTPSETIERKDLAIAIAISDSRSEDELMHAVALVQDLTPDESITRGFHIKRNEVVGKYVTLIDQNVSGQCTDFVPRDQTIAGRSDQHQMVIDGQIVYVPVHEFIVIAPPSEGLGLKTAYSTTSDA